MMLWVELDVLIYVADYTIMYIRLMCGWVNITTFSIDIVEHKEYHTVTK